MSHQSLASIVSRIVGQFSYLVAHAPDEFPEEDQSSIEGELKELREGIVEVISRISGEERKELLTLSTKEIERVGQLFASSKNDDALRLLQLAEAHFRDGWEGRQPDRTIIVDPTGGTKV